MKLKLAAVVLSGLVIALAAFAGDGVETAMDKKCEGTVIDRLLCQKMTTLRSQIFALEAQREIMQVNPSFIAALGKGLSETARQALQLLGPDLPEHRQGLASLALMADDMAYKASKGDGDMMSYANTMRTNCATCHTSRNPPGDFGWDDIFNSRWEDVSKHCRQPGKNPYLCKSMYTMLSTQTYNHMALQAHIEDYDLTREVAIELLRVITDLEERGFRHLPADKRQEAQEYAREIIEMADAKNTQVFVKARNFVNACNTCHASREGGGGIIRPIVGPNSWQ